MNAAEGPGLGGALALVIGALAMVGLIVPFVIVFRGARRAEADGDEPPGRGVTRKATRQLGAARLPSRRPAGVLLAVVLVAIGGAVALAAALRRDDSPARAPDSSPAATFRAARDGVCSAAAGARGGDVTAARDTFFDRSHQPLHDLAAAAQRTDRAVAGRLLEAKAAVEAGLEDAKSSLPADLDALATATGRAMGTVGGVDPGPCPS